MAIIVSPNPRDVATTPGAGAGDATITTPPVDVIGTPTGTTTNTGTLSINLNLGASVIGGITAPGQTAWGGTGTFVRFLAPNANNTDPNSIWYRYNYSFATTGKITWTLIPPTGVSSQILTTDTVGTSAYFDISQFGLYKVVATITDNNGQTMSSYTQIASLGDGTASNFSSSAPKPAFDLTWTGSTAVTTPAPGTTTPNPTQPTTPVVVPPTTPVALGKARNYSSQATEQTLTSGINSVVTQITVSSAAGFPASLPYTLLLDYGQASEEIVTVTAASGTSLTIVRGEDGSAPVAHAAGAKVRHGITGRDLREPQAHINAGAGVHGLAGNVVGTVDAQTLTSKTMDGQLNVFRNIPSSALGTDVATTTTAQELRSKTLDGNYNTFKNIPASALAAGASGTLTADNTATLSNKTIDGNLNTLRNIPLSAVQGLSTQNLQSRYWYCNGTAWNQRTNESSTNDYVLFQLNLGPVDPGWVIVTSALVLDIFGSIKVEWFIDGGTTWQRRAMGLTDYRYSTQTLAKGITIPTTSAFAFSGGNLLLRGVVNQNGGDGSYSTLGTYSRCEIAWFGGGDVAHSTATNTATLNQTA